MKKKAAKKIKSKSAKKEQVLKVNATLDQLMNLVATTPKKQSIKK